MADLARQRCANHAHREAAALCPGCRRYFCRECVTEHDDRVWCADCLAKLARPTLARRLRLAALFRLACLALGFFVLWMFFDFCGRTLLAIPSQYHDGTFLTRPESEQ